jgi:hypothetical protein
MHEVRDVRARVCAFIPCVRVFVHVRVILLCTPAQLCVCVCLRVRACECCVLRAICLFCPRSKVWNRLLSHECARVHVCACMRVPACTFTCRCARLRACVCVHVGAWCAR